MTALGLLLSATAMGIVAAIFVHFVRLCDSLREREHIQRIKVSNEAVGHTESAPDQ